MKTSVVVAHYAATGELRPDSRAVIAELRRRDVTVVLCSTRLSAAAAATVPHDVHVITRDNYGYDFYSYRVGIEHLIGQSGGESVGRLVMFNSSFYVVDIDRFIEHVLMEQASDIYGITESLELGIHLQSYFVSFKKAVVKSDSFKAWWEQVEPIDDRQTVISKYEIGMSRWFIERGFSLQAAVGRPCFRSSLVAKWRALRSGHAIRRPSVIFNARRLNPTIFFWEDVLTAAGIVKVEALERSPYGVKIPRSVLGAGWRS